MSADGSPSVISAHSRPPLLASGATFDRLPYGCLLFMYRLDLTRSELAERGSWEEALEEL